MISNEKLTEIYAAMLRCRMIAQRAGSLFQYGKLGNNLPFPVGNEASAVASVIDLGPSDVLCLRDDDLMPGIVKGASLANTFRSLALARKDRSREEPYSQTAEFKQLNILPMSTVDAQIKTVRECAKVAKREKEGRVILAFPACGKESRGRWDEAIQLAGSRNLPIIFVVYAAWNSEEHPGPRDATLNGIPAIVVDGADAVAIYRVACEAIARARQGRGPTIMECITVHDASATAKVEDRIHIEMEHPVLNDPNLTMEEYLRRKGLWSEPSFRQWLADCGRELDLATRFLED